MLESLFNNFEKITSEKPPGDETPETTKNYNSEAFREIEEPFGELVSQLKKPIEAGKYDVLISDDAGGRLPTLAIRKIIVGKTEKKPQTFFFPGPHYYHEKLLKTFQNERLLESIREAAQKSNGVLVITEYSHTGGTLHAFDEMLKKMGVLSDFAIVVSSSDNYALRKKVIGDSTAQKIYVGRTGGIIPRIDFDSRELGGVLKVAGKLVKDKRLSEYRLYRRLMGEAREDVQLLYERTLEKVWGRKEKAT